MCSFFTLTVIAVGSLSLANGRVRKIEKKGNQARSRFSGRVIYWCGAAGEEEGRGIFGCLHKSHRCFLGFVFTINMPPRVMKYY